MRLTLRTLLAYLDDILDPADAHELGQKIEQSEFASSLVQSIRSVTRKLRLGAPRLSGKGMGLDPNTVAEYLDNTLPPDRIPDFEKVCIESDVHLAEVASCHQILTLVVGEPADVDPALRERIRGLHVAALMPGAPGESSDSATAAAEQAVAGPEPPPVEPPPQEEDKVVRSLQALHAGRSPRTSSALPRWVPVVGTVLVAFLLAVVALLAIGPLDSRHPILGGMLASREEADEDSSAPPSGKPEPSDEEPSSQPPAGPADEDLPPADAQPAPPVTPPPSPGQKKAPGTAPAKPLATDSPAGQPTEAGDSVSPKAPAGKAATDLEPAAGDVAKRPPGPLESMVPEGIPGKSQAKPAAAADAAAKEAEDANDVGRYLSDQHVLARFDPATGAWFRLPPLQALQAGDELIALPTYRPQLALTPGIQIVLIGPARMVVQPPDNEGVPAVRLQFGRMLVVTDGGVDSALDVQFGPRRGRLTFSSPDAMLALAARHYLPPGENPESFPAYHVLAMQALDGPLKWNDRDEPEPTLLAAGDAATLIDQERPIVEPAEEKPPWIDAGDMPLIDRDASKALEPLLVPKRPLSLSLQEQVSNRLVEVRALAIRCLGMLNQFDAYIDAFHDEDLRSYWDGLVESLVGAVARDPATAARIRETFERLRGDKGSQLYRLLWGFSPQQLEEGAARTLVGLLSSEAMDLRVLAFANLMHITQRSHMYRPEREPERQKPAILKWQRTLEEGGIVYKDPPPPMPERPVPAPAEPAQTAP